MMQHFIVLVLLAASMNLSFEFDMSEQEMKTTKGKFCGPNLSDTLSLICGNVFNQKKRSDYVNNRQNDLEGYPEALLAYPFRSRQLAKSIIPSQFRKRSNGVASECCHKSCSLWEMSGYCGTIKVEQ